MRFSLCSLFLATTTLGGIGLISTGRCAAETPIAEGCSAIQDSGSKGNCSNSKPTFCRAMADCGNWYQNTSVFSGVEAYKGIGDTTLPPNVATGFMNSAGFVNGMNTGFRLGDRKLRAQVGGSFGVYDLKGRDTAVPGQTENQGFITTGLFKRSDVNADERLSYGIVYDQLIANNWGVGADSLYLGQIRGITGVAMNSCNEVGFWGAVRTNSQTLTSNPDQSVEAINQGNLYWSHNYSMGARSMVYAGLTDHSSFGSWTTGTQFTAPMTDRISLYGNSGFLFPSSSKGPVGSNELLWSISCGLSYSFGGKAVSRNISGQCGTPLLPVANNGTFFVGNNALTPMNNP